MNSSRLYLISLAFFLAIGYAQNQLKIVTDVPSVTFSLRPCSKGSDFLCTSYFNSTDYCCAYIEASAVNSYDVALKGYFCIDEVKFGGINTFTYGVL
jgi:hypothetical protein